MRRNVKIVLLLSCAWMFAFVYYYHTSRDTKVSQSNVTDFSLSALSVGAKKTREAASRETFPFGSVLPVVDRELDLDAHGSPA